MTTQNLSGKVALIQGGSRGIGAAIVKRLAAEGATVAFTYVSSTAKAEELQNSITQAGGKALAIKADSADAEAIRGAVTATVEAFGQLDILVNSAGVLHLAPVDQFSLADFDRTIAVNVRAVFVASQAAAAHMKDGGQHHQHRKHQCAAHAVRRRRHLRHEQIGADRTGQRHGAQPG